MKRKIPLLIIIFSVSYTSVVSSEQITRNDNLIEITERIYDSNENWTFLGFKGGVVTTLDSSDSHLYAGIDGLGLFRKELADTDLEWNYLGFYGKKITSIQILSGTPDTIYVGLYQQGRNKLFFNKYNSHSLYKSTNDGKSWITWDRGIQFGGLIFKYRFPVFSISISKDEPDTMYVMSSAQIYTTLNGGRWWRRVWGAPFAIEYQSEVVTIDPITDDIVWSGGESAIFQPRLINSIDGGQSWVYLNPPCDGDNAVYSIMIDPLNSNIVYIGMEGHIAKTKNSGEDWTVILSPDDYPYFKAMVLDPFDSQHIFVGAGPNAAEDPVNNPSALEVYESYDSGETWKCHEVEPEKGGRRVTSLILDIKTDSKILYVGTLGGVWSYQYNYE